jgi:hypothetical protein
VNNSITKSPSVPNNSQDHKPAEVREAQAAIKRGSKVVRLERGSKAPTSSGWQAQATDDATAVEAWPAPFNYFEIIPRSVLVLDIDGLEAGNQFQREHGELPETWSKITPGLKRGQVGLHLYYRVPADVPPGARHFPGVDIFTQGGWVVGAGSAQHYEGRRAVYRWAPGHAPDEIPLADAPEWLVELARAPAPAQKEKRERGGLDALRVSDEIKALIRSGKPKGERSEALFAAMRAMVNAGHADGEIVAALMNPAHGLSEKPREKGEAWLHAEIKRAREKPDRARPIPPEIERLARLSRIEYDRVREAMAGELEVRVSTLDEEVKAVRQRLGFDKEETGLQGQPLTFLDSEPWPEPIDGAKLLDELVGVFKKYLVLPEYAAEALALWAIHTHAPQAADVAPMIALTSPVEECGKSRTFRVLRRLVRRPLVTSGISPAAIFRSIEQAHPTLLMDELDALLEKDHTGDVRGLLDAGYSREDARVVRIVGENHEPRAFDVFGPKAVALIGNLNRRWRTVASRSIVICMQRKPRTVKLPRLPRPDNELETLRRKIARYVQDNLTALTTADPAIPECLNDRAADNWLPLIAIADCAGGRWPERARQAAEALSGNSRASDATGICLLTDIRRILDNENLDRIATKDLIAKLHKLDEPSAPWSEWGPHGRGITDRKIAELLKPYGIESKTIRVEGGTPKGYERAQFEEAFSRYLPPSPPSDGQQRHNPRKQGNF